MRAVIVILGIIVAIAVPATGNIISDSENKADDAEIELLLYVARLANANKDFDREDGMTAEVLQEKGYLEGDVDDFPNGTVSYNEPSDESSGSRFQYSN